MRILKITAVLMIVITLLSPACYASQPDSKPNTIDNYDEYKAFVKEHRDELPDKFVHFHSVSALGEFAGFMELPSAGSYESQPILSNYRYIITDKNGYQIQLDIYQDNVTSFEEDIVPLKSGFGGLSMDGVMDLRYHPNGDNRVLELNDCYYYYRDWKLSCIAWQSRGVIFKMTFDESVFDGANDAEKSTLVTGLLNPKTAKFNTGRLKRMAYRNLNYEYPWLLPSIIGLITLITVSLVITNIRHPIKKKSPDDPPKANETPR